MNAKNKPFYPVDHRSSLALTEKGGDAEYMHKEHGSAKLKNLVKAVCRNVHEEKSKKS
jgi:hypothetical protein